MTFRNTLKVKTNKLRNAIYQFNSPFLYISISFILYRRSIRASTRSRLSKVKKEVHSLAATTPLVRSIFENFFTEQLEKDASKQNAPRRKRCGVCEV